MKSMFSKAFLLLTLPVCFQGMDLTATPCGHIAASYKTSAAIAPGGSL